jgi:hypothetical protein
MAGKYDDNLSGALFKNDNKQRENQPDYRGSCEIEGTQYWMSAWIKQIGKGDRAGQSFMSISFQEKEDSKPRAKAKPAPVDHGDDLDDSIPF